ncbi:RES domain protein [Stutzerimonas stutzeri]|nr:RES domain protein [Stutzerimonas stutzeri]
MKITEFELPEDAELYLEPSEKELPVGWAALPADKPSMSFGTDWLNRGSHLGLIVPSAVLPLERNIVLNPRHPAISRVKISRIMDFTYDDRLFAIRS